MEKPALAGDPMNSTVRPNDAVFMTVGGSLIARASDRCIERLAVFRVNALVEFLISSAEGIWIDAKQIGMNGRPDNLA